MIDNSDTAPIVTDNDETDGVIEDASMDNEAEMPEIKVYKRRWYILGLFCVLACHQCIVQNPFGPIESSVQYAYGWTDFEAPMMANWGCIMFVIAVVPLSKLAEVITT